MFYLCKFCGFPGSIRELEDHIDNYHLDETDKEREDAIEELNELP